jgi:hypothetical protein
MLKQHIKDLMQDFLVFIYKVSILHAFRYVPKF